MQTVRRWKYPIIALVLIAVGLISWKAWASRAPKLDASAENIRTFVASDQFKDLPPKEQKQYADAMFDKGRVVLKNGDMTPETEAAMKNAASAHRQAMLD